MGLSSTPNPHPPFRLPKSPRRPTSSTSFHISQRARSLFSSGAPSPRSSFVVSPRLHIPFRIQTRHARSTLFRLLCPKMLAQTDSHCSAQLRIQICSTLPGSPRTKRSPLLRSTLNQPSVSHVRGSTHPRTRTLTMHPHPVPQGPLASDISASTPLSHNASPSNRASTSLVCSMRRKTREIAHQLIGTRPSPSPQASPTPAASRAPIATRPTCQSGSQSHPSRRQCSSSKTRIRKVTTVGL
jgi:hypothetical protein